jgi:hypothetical protein
VRFYQTQLIDRKPGKYGVILLMHSQAAPRDGSVAADRGMKKATWK